MKFVKRAQVVDAVRFDVAKDTKPEYFFNGEYPVFYDPDTETGVPYLRVSTPDGSKRADVGDWVVKTEGEKGSATYIFTSEEFHLKYEGVNENFANNSEGFISAYKNVMAKLKEGGKKLMSAEALAGMVAYKSGEQFELSVKAQRVVVEKPKTEKEKEEPKKDV